MKILKKKIVMALFQRNKVVPKVHKLFVSLVFFFSNKLGNLVTKEIFIGS